MSNSEVAVTTLSRGARVLGEDGYFVVLELGWHGVSLANSLGERREVPYGELAGVGIAGGTAAPTLKSLEPWWGGLPDRVRHSALDILEVVLEVLTGYRWGDPRLAQPGEPYLPFGDENTSISKRCARMAEVLTYEASTDRSTIRRLVDGEIASVVRLTARAPWFDGMAALYAFACNRWDTPAELISCGPNQQPEGSGWDGTVVFVDFTAPEPGEYVIVVAVHGPQSVVQVRGPWGVIDRPMPAGQDHQLVGTTWSGAGELHFTITFFGRWLGVVSGVQIFEQVE